MIMWFSTLLSFFGIMIFLYGYIQVPSNNNIEENDIIYNKTSVNKVVLVIIDALRFDMVESNESPLFAIKNGLYPNSSIIKKVKLQLPSVTMPRIKTITSGNIGSFIDLIFNIRSSRIFDDNIIDILRKERSYVINFYGDDTWLKLFPLQFKKFQGTTSFFVKDYFEVDRNVTRHIPELLNDIENWDMTILHYLGLDHIGHVEGPLSKLVPGKLEEMRDSITAIVDGIIKSKKFNDTLIIVTGDHGMSDLGGHGGATVNELTTAAIFFNERLLKSETLNHDDFIFQSDLPTAIALLTGVRIPKNSLGVMPYFLLQMVNNIRHRTDALYSNFWHFVNQRIEHSEQFETEFEAIKDRLERLHNECHSSGDSYQCVTDINKCHRQLITLLRSMQAVQMTKTSTVDPMSMEAGFTLLIVSLFFTIYDLFLPNFITISGCLISIIFTTIFFIENFQNFLLMKIFKLSLSIILLILLFMDISPRKNSLSTAVIRLFSTPVKWNWCIFLIPILNCVSYLSSSFIEEEHQLWYFLLTTFIVVNLIRSLLLNYRQDTSNDNLSTLLVHSLLFVLDRGLRTLNQTGDKWSHLPDVGDWLNKPDNQLFFIASLAASLIILYQLLSFKYPWANITLGVFIGANMSYRVLLSVGYSSEYYDPLIYICYLVAAEHLAVYIYHRCHIHQSPSKQMSLMSKYLSHYKSMKLSNIVLLLMSLLCRSHNLILLAGLAIKRLLVKRLWFRDFRSRKVSEQVVIFHMLGMVSFFQQGNSHSLATIDIQTGYVGIVSYQPLLIGILLTIHTWFGHLFWTIVFLEWLSSSQSPHCNSHRRLSHTVTGAMNLISTGACVSLMCVCSVLKHHLFVWSVFTPRLMYCCFFNLFLVPLYVLLANIYV